MLKLATTLANLTAAGSTFAANADNPLAGLWFVSACAWFGTAAGTALAAWWFGGPVEGDEED